MQELDRELALLEKSEKVHTSIENLVKGELVRIKEKKNFSRPKKPLTVLTMWVQVQLRSQGGTPLQEYLLGVDLTLDAAVQSLLAFENTIDS